MRLPKHLVICILLVSTFIAIQTAIGYTAEDTLVFDQIPITVDAVENGTLEVAIIIKNFFNYTVTDVQVSLNLTDSKELSFVSCEFGELNGTETITLNTTIETTDKYDFTPVNVTYGLLTKKYLEFNISSIAEGAKVLFRYNITSSADGDYIIPRAEMVYHDNWGDEHTISSANQIQVHFNPAEEEKDPYLPNWDGKRQVSNTVGWIIFIAVPFGAAFIASFVGMIRFGQKE